MSERRAPQLDDLSDPETFGSLLASVRSGSLEAQGRLLEAFRHDLLLTAESNLDSALRAKLGASDIVQESLLEAHRDFGRFRGVTRQEVRAWLKRILLNNLLNHVRWWNAEKRHVHRETAVEGNGHPSVNSVADSALSASQLVGNGEQREQLLLALTGLKSEYREVLELRHREGLPFDEIGRCMNRSADSARMLWYRAFDQLSRKLDAPSSMSPATSPPVVDS